MKYLLIDFGASYIKTITYDKYADSYSKCDIIESPFLNKSILHKKECLSILESLLDKYTNIDRIIICTILGGHYENDIYYSWKINSKIKNQCLISGLFFNESTFHIHEHHKDTTSYTNYEKGLRILGFIKHTPIYSALSDTGCVIESVDLKSDDLIVNMGTGSQVIYFKEGKEIRHSFIPSGRSLLVFYNFFKSINLDIFELFKKATISKVVNSTMEIDLNVFKQSHKYSDGGFIKKINEDDFNIENLVYSILRCYVKQYLPYIEQSKCKNIILTGGIPKKIPVIKELLSIYSKDCNVKISNIDIENTHLGMINKIKTCI